MSESQSPSKPGIARQINQETRALKEAHLRGDLSACARIRKFSPRFSQASDAAILAASDIDAHEVVAREHGFESLLAVHEAELGHKFLRGDASLEHLKKQAKKLLKAFQAGDESAVERVRVSFDKAEFTLNDAHFVLAREYGFASWPKLVAKLETPDGTTLMSRPQLLAMEGMHKQCVQPLGEVFSHHLGQRAVGDVAFVDQTTYGEFIHSVSGSAGQDRCLCSFAVEAMRSRSVLDISMRLIFALLGRSEDSEQVLSKEDIERMEPVFRDALAEVQRAWEPVLPTVIGDMKIETNPELVAVAEASAVVVLIAFDISTQERSGLVSLAYPVADGLFELREHFVRKS